MNLFTCSNDNGTTHFCCVEVHRVSDIGVYQVVGMLHYEARSDLLGISVGKKTKLFTKENFESLGDEQVYFIVKNRGFVITRHAQLGAVIDFVKSTAVALNYRDQLKCVADISYESFLQLGVLVND